jgi:adenylate cyclase
MVVVGSVLRDGSAGEGWSLYRMAWVPSRGVRVAEGAGDAGGSSTGVKPGALTALLQEVAATPEQRGDEPKSLPPGAVVGRFEVVRELGRGGFGVVYEARDRDLGRQVALKVVRPGRAAADEGKVAREAEAIARLAHPNLITLYDVGRSEGGPYLVLELLRGKTLQERVDDGPLTTQEAVHVGTEVARGLAYAHAEGVVHRDLKPSNVFLTSRGQVKILDFGMAHAFGRRRISGGTPAYMAPEQWEDNPEDERTDVFALGVMLYRMLSGEHPFPEGEGRWSAGPATAPRLDVPGAPGLAELVERMLDKSPKGRPRDGAMALAALAPIEDALRTRPADGRPPTYATRRKATLGDLLEELRRRRVFRGLLGYGIFALAVLQVAEPIVHALTLPEWTLKAVITTLALGFPVAAALAWAFDLTSRGIIRAAPPEESTEGPSSRARLRVAAVLAGLGLLAAAPGVIYFFVWPGRAPPNAPGSGTTGDGQGRPSIAVLPFVDMSPGKDQGYLADGIPEEILNALTQVEGLRVIGRTSSFSFKGKDATLATIGRTLRAGTLLEGSVRREGDRVRVAAKLVRVDDEAPVWSQTFDRELDGVLAIQDEIARAVVDALKVRLLPGRVGFATVRRAPAPDVYEQYLLGREYIRHGPTERNARLSAEAYERALALDGTYAPAWAGYARALLVLSDHAPTEVSMAEARRKALEAADRAIALDPVHPDGWLERAFVRLGILQDFTGAQSDAEKALSLAPGSAGAMTLRGDVLLVLGRLDEGSRVLQGAAELDPLFAHPLVLLAQAQLEQGDLGSARAGLERALKVSPDNPFARNVLGVAWLLEGKASTALEVFEQLPDEVWRVTGQAMALHTLGHRAAADEALRALTTRFAHNGAYQIATVHAWRGERDAAFDWLERAWRQRDGGLVDIKYDPLLRPLRGDPRYAALLGKLKLPVE